MGGLESKAEANYPHSVEYGDHELEKEELSEYWQGINATNRELIEFKTSETHGLGLFARVDVPPRQLLETCPLFPMSSQSEHAAQKGAARFFGNFTFNMPCTDGTTAEVLVLGKTSCANHSDDPNAQVKLNGHSLLLASVKAIQAGEQIFISYGDSYFRSRHAQAR